jgi:hypothetical protein
VVHSPGSGEVSYPFRAPEPASRQIADHGKGPRPRYSSGAGEEPTRSCGPPESKLSAGGAGPSFPDTAGGASTGAPPPDKRGIQKPAHNRGVQKYRKVPNQGPVHHLLLSHMRKNKSLRLNDHYRHVCLDLVIASLAKNTWQHYDSA